MATHPKHAGITPKKRLDKLLEHHEYMVDALRAVMGEMNGHATHAKQNGHKTVITQAIALDEARRAREDDGRSDPAVRRSKKKKKRHGGVSIDVRDQRRRTAAALALFDAKVPKDIADVAEQLGMSRSFAGPLVRRGYLRGKGNGYIRTPKAYHINPAHPEET